ncbi:unnamed protein product [Diamesa serratosioi]
MPEKVSRIILSKCKLFERQTGFNDCEQAILIQAIELLMYCYLSLELLPFLYAVVKTFHYGDNDGFAFDEGFGVVRRLMEAKKSYKFESN